MKNRKIFFVAMKEETEPIIKHYKMSDMGDYYSDGLNDLYITGIGIANILKTLTKFKYKNLEDKQIYNIGYVGSNMYVVGSIVEITKFKRLNPPKKVPGLDIEFTSGDNNFFESATLYTTDDFVDLHENDISLPERSVVDMEGFYLKCYFSNLISIKIVSDNFSIEDFDKNIKDNILEESWSKVLKCLK